MPVFRQPLASVRQFLGIALRREIVGRAVRTALVVGTVVAVINHGPAIAALSREPLRFFQIGLSYLVPYFVATYAAAHQELRHKAQAAVARQDVGDEAFHEQQRKAW
jgi:hypothetical protein